MRIDQRSDRGLMARTCRGQLVDLCRDAVLFEERFLHNRTREGQPTKPATAQRRAERPTFVKWNWSGSSVLRLTLRPVRKKLGNGLRSYVRKRALFESGDMAICAGEASQCACNLQALNLFKKPLTPICLR